VEAEEEVSECGRRRVFPDFFRGRIGHRGLSGFGELQLATSNSRVLRTEGKVPDSPLGRGCWFIDNLLVRWGYAAMVDTICNRSGISPDASK